MSMDNAMYLSSYCFVEPEEPLHLYYPSWLNVWESHAYNNALKATGAKSWGFKRFGTLSDTYFRESARKTNYIPYIEAMEKASETALHELSAKERMLLLKSRTAFIYVDSWGESGSFEYNITALHSSTIDTLPKNLVKKFSVKDVTCKIRGEKNSFIQAMQVAQDYLNWDIFDFVIICGGYRAVPLLEFSAENNNSKIKKDVARDTSCINISIERVGCFIFSKRESSLKINCGKYVKTENYNSHLHTSENTLISCAGRTNNISSFPMSQKKMIKLVNIYGFSGCLTPALSWQYLAHRSLSGGCIRTILPVGLDSYSFFDTWY